MCSSPFSRSIYVTGPFDFPSSSIRTIAFSKTLARKANRVAMISWMIVASRLYNRNTKTNPMNTSKAALLNMVFTFDGKLLIQEREGTLIFQTGGAGFLLRQGVFFIPLFPICINKKYSRIKIVRSSTTIKNDVVSCCTFLLGKSKIDCHSNDWYGDFPGFSRVFFGGDRNL